MKTTRRSGEWISVTEHARVLGIDPGTRIAGYAVIDFNARDSLRLYECYIYTFTHPNYTTFLGVLEVVITMTGTILLVIGLVRAGLGSKPAHAPA